MSDRVLQDERKQAPLSLIIEDQATFFTDRGHSEHVSNAMAIDAIRKQLSRSTSRAHLKQLRLVRKAAHIAHHKLNRRIR